MRLGYLFQTNEERRLRASAGLMASGSFIGARKAHMHYQEVHFPPVPQGAFVAVTVDEMEQSFEARNGWAMHAWLPVQVSYRFIPYAELMLELRAGTGWMKPGGTDVLRSNYSAAVAGGLRFLPGR